MAKVWATFKGAVWALFMPVIILGGIYGGVFTPTEAAAVSCAYGLFVGSVIYRELTARKLYQIMYGAVVSTAMIMLIIACATVFGLVMTREMIPMAVAKWILSVSQDKFTFLLLVTMLLFVVGTFLDAVPAVMILTPIFRPVLTQYGIDPAAFGVIMIINLGIGLVTPPVGMNLYVAAGLKKTGIENVLGRDLAFYIFCATGVLVLLMVFPEIISFLPGLMK